MHAVARILVFISFSILYSAQLSAQTIFPESGISDQEVHEYLEESQDIFERKTKEALDELMNSPEGQKARENKIRMEKQIEVNRITKKLVANLFPVDSVSDQFIKVDYKVYGSGRSRLRIVPKGLLSEKGSTIEVYINEAFAFRYIQQHEASAYYKLKDNVPDVNSGDAITMKINGNLVLQGIMENK